MIAVISHDAGGAEVISSYVRQQGLTCIYALEGPALKIFERKLGRIESLPLEFAIRSSSSILCGTGWQSDLEFNAIKLARFLGKHSVAFLDHWGNYCERFIRTGETCMPDEIWVCDEIAKAMASATFPGTNIRQIENPYFQDLQREFAAITRSRPSKSLPSILYVCEPVREHALLRFGNERHWGYTEEDALRYFLSNIGALGSPVECIVIRPHPSEPPGKYDWVVCEFELPITFGGTSPLLTEIAASDVVVGCNSMAMVVGLLAGKRVISCIPPRGQACTLPQPEIQSLQFILAKQAGIQMP